METLAERLKRLRFEKKMTQEALAKASGVSASAIKLIEAGTSRRPYEDTMSKLAMALGMSTEELEFGLTLDDGDMYQKERYVPPRSDEQRTRALGASFRSLRKMNLEQLREAEEYLRLMADDEFN